VVFGVNSKDVTVSPLENCSFAVRTEAAHGRSRPTREARNCPHPFRLVRLEVDKAPSPSLG
jgi:hypothetical protein